MHKINAWQIIFFSLFGVEKYQQLILILAYESFANRIEQNGTLLSLVNSKKKFFLAIRYQPLKKIEIRRGKKLRSERRGTHIHRYHAMGDRWSNDGTQPVSTLVTGSIQACTKTA